MPSPDYRPTANPLAGRIVTLRHTSQALQGNPWNDPVERDVAVYLPPDYAEGAAPYPVLWDLAAYTNSGLGHLNWRNHGESLPQRLDRLILSDQLKPCICVFPDCYTSLGGNQYVNSPAIGNYADYLAYELVPFIEQNLHTISGPEGRSLFGKSSGGFGAIYLACHFPGIWGAIAAHAPDVGFDRVYLPDFPKVCAVLAAYKNDLREFVRYFWAKNQPKGNDFHALMVLCLAASYDPDPAEPSRIRLPFSLDTCELDANTWSRWLTFDPLQMMSKYRNELKQLRHFWLDVGRQDQYNIQFGARQFSRQMRETDISHQYEEFEGTHSGIDWRLDLSLRSLLLK